MGYAKECKIIRRCGGCGKKMVFECAGKFRVNANGRRLDVWLIYRCQRCGRPHSVYRKFGLCRVCLRELANKGDLPGVRKASW